ncbi:hypothetical protein [Barnesiella intestinihominis]|uniref:hypothetical protein n=1 Tax=Barnesiella intestinihominis TaxID=487174 RepID=UPI003FF025F3
MESFQPYSSIFDEESKRGRRRNAIHLIRKFMSISSKFLLSRLSFPLLGKNISLYGT